MGKYALSGVRVLDMTHVQAGPTSSQLLAWMGADVIKFEPPGTGDITRSQLTHLKDADGKWIDSLYFTMLNSNKRSITVNMKSKAGCEAFEALIKNCDVMMENFGPGVLDRFGYPFEKLMQINPGLIYATLKGFGASGPYAEFKAYEPIAQAMSGAMSTCGFPEGPPTITSSQVGDTGTGLHLAIGICAALYHRTHNGGKGQMVEVAMVDGCMNLCRVKYRDHGRLMGGKGALAEYSRPTLGLTAVPRAGNDSGGGQLGNCIPCKPFGKDDYVYMVLQEAIFPALCEMIGGEALKNDERFLKIADRRKNQNELWKIIGDYAKNYTKFELTALFNSKDFPCGPVLTTEDATKDEHFRHRKMWVEVKDEKRGNYWTVGMPVKLSEGLVPEILRAPLLGEHTDEILTQVCKFSADQVKAMHEGGAFTVPERRKK
jgi:formyl-CoA transferase